jgi:hypothetical protein
VEELLKKKKQALGQMEVPEEMEERLRFVLRNLPLPRRGIKKWKMMIAACVLILLIATQSNTLAYYAKHLVGYNQIMNGTLQELNELGKGQSIGKDYYFKNGTQLTLDGIMLDDNQLIAFYTVKGVKGNLEQLTVFGISGKKGDYYFSGSEGQLNNDGTEIKYVGSFEPPYFFEKDLSFRFSMTAAEFNRGVEEFGEVAFQLDRDQAMGHILKKEIHQTLNIDGNRIRFESILASPTTTVIKGVIQYPWELAWDQIIGERIRPQKIDIRLLANGRDITKQGSGMKTDITGIRFSHQFDALSTPLEKLQIQVISFQADHDVQEKVEIIKDVQDQPIKILGQDIVLKNIMESGGETFLTISSEDSVILTGVQMIMDGKEVRLEDTRSDVHEKKPGGIIEHTRTLHFKGTGQKLQLLIKRMTYKQTLDKIIDIPVD